MLSVTHLTKSFDTPTGTITVLSEIGFDLGAGQSLAVTGPSGSGKSTLLQIVGTLDRPSSGQVLLDGLDPFALSADSLAAFRNRHIGFIFQDHYLLPQLTLWQNTVVPALAGQNRVPPVIIDRATDLLTRVGLGDRLDFRPGELSGGQRQRGAIARALLLKPTLLLADEPTGNLDAENAQMISDTLTDLMRDEPIGLIVVTHSRSLAQRMDRELSLTGGRAEVVR